MRDVQHFLARKWQSWRNYYKSLELLFILYGVRLTNYVTPYKEMTRNLLSPNAKSSQPFKKRKIDPLSMDVNNTDNFNRESSFNSQNDVDSESPPDNTGLTTKCKNEESEEDTTPNESPQNTPKKIASNHQTCLTSHTSCNSIKMEEENNEVNNTAIVNNNNELNNDSTRQSLISVCKMEDLCETPTKTFTADDNIDIEACKIENDANNLPPTTPSSNSNTSFSMSHSQTIKTLEETPVSTKKERLIFQEKTPKQTPSRKKRRKISSASDYDQLSDTIKSELCDAVNIQDMEAIDLLHDMENMIHFEDSKISPAILLSSVNDTNENADEKNVETIKDPLEDPLFIATNDEEETWSEKTEDNQLEFNKNSDIKDKNIPRRSMRKPVPESPNKSESNKEETCTDTANMESLEKTYEMIDDILDDLDFTDDEEDCSEFMRAQLYKLKVNLQHKVPPQHKIESTAGSHPLNLREKGLFLRHGPLRKGVFSPTEDAVIIKNWNIFCKVHDWDPRDVYPFLTIKHANKYYISSLQERQKFVQFLANGLPWRSLYSVYQRFKKLYTVTERNNNRYSKFEDWQILKYMENRITDKATKKWSELAEKLGRTKHSILLRYKKLKKAQSVGKKLVSRVDWTMPLTCRFIKELLNTTLSENIGELKNAVIPKPVWSRLEKKLFIEQNSLKTFWLEQLHMQLYCPHTIYLNDIKIELIEYMYVKGITNTREIIWPNVARYFDGMTTIFLCKVFFSLVREVTSKTGFKDFGDVMEYMYNEKIHEIRDQWTDKCLPRISYRNGKIAIVDGNVNNVTHVEENVDTEK